MRRQRLHFCAMLRRSVGNVPHKIHVKASTDVVVDVFAASTAQAEKDMTLDYKTVFRAPCLELTKCLVGAIKV